MVATHRAPGTWALLSILAIVPLSILSASTVALANSPYAIASQAESATRITYRVTCLPGNAPFDEFLLEIASGDTPSDFSAASFPVGWAIDPVLQGTRLRLTGPGPRPGAHPGRGARPGAKVRCTSRPGRGAPRPAELPGEARSVSGTFAPASFSLTSAATDR